MPRALDLQGWGRGMGWLCCPHPGSSLAPEMQGQAQKLRILGVGYVTDP